MSRCSRTAPFRRDAEQRAQLEARGIRIEPRVVEALTGDAPGLSGVRLVDGDVFEIDGLFTHSRTRMASPLAKHLCCVFEDGVAGLIVRTDAPKETTVPGVYCVGDATRSMHNATFAAADGAKAGIAAHQSLVFAPMGRQKTRNCQSISLRGRCADGQGISWLSGSSNVRPPPHIVVAQVGGCRR